MRQGRARCQTSPSFSLARATTPRRARARTTTIRAMTVLLCASRLSRPEPTRFRPDSDPIPQHDSFSHVRLVYLTALLHPPAQCPEASRARVSCALASRARSRLPQGEKLLKDTYEAVRSGYACRHQQRSTSAPPPALHVPTSSRCYTRRQSGLEQDVADCDVRRRGWLLRPRPAANARRAPAR